MVNKHKTFIYIYQSDHKQEQDIFFSFSQGPSPVQPTNLVARAGHLNLIQTDRLKSKQQGKKQTKQPRITNKLTKQPEN